MLDYRALQQGAPQSTQDWLQKIQRGQYIAPLVPDCPPPVPASPPEAEPARRAPRTSSSSSNQLLAKMVVYPEKNLGLAADFIEAASRLGERSAHVLYQEGVRVVIIPKGKVASQVVLAGGERVCEKGARAHGGFSVDSVRGFYDRQKRLVVVREAYVHGRVVVHELAHALDDALSRRMNLGEPLSTMLWNRFQDSRKIVADGYMLQGPHEYFAVSLELYHSRKGRATLSRIDPKLLQFLDGFLS